MLKTTLALLLLSCSCATTPPQTRPQPTRCWEYQGDFIEDNSDLDEYGRKGWEASTTVLIVFGEERKLFTLFKRPCRKTKKPRRKLERLRRVPIKP